MIRLIHISDTHYHTHDQDNQEADRLFALLLDMYPHHYIILTGDVTDDGGVDQFRQALKALSPFKGRIFICPGNHDYGYLGNIFEPHVARRFDAMLMEPLAQGGKFFGEGTGPVWNFIEPEDGGAVLLIGLDSNLETINPLDFAAGEIGKNQLNQLSALLHEFRDPRVKKIVFMHHHPFDADPFVVLKDSAALCRTLWRRADMLLFGHKHERGMWQRRWGMPYILASDNSPFSNQASEIIIDNEKIRVRPVFYTT